MPSNTALELRQQVGQLMIVGFDGTGPSARLRSMLGTISPAGVILFKRNIEDAAQVHALLRDAQNNVVSPMFRCADMEGGTVDRLRDVIARIPNAAEVAATRSAKLFRKHGQLIGNEIRALAFNTDFAPSLDLRLPASEKVMGSRTASPDPEAVTRFAREFLRGLKDAGVLGCGKHFPGLGGAELDSHFSLPSVPRTWKAVWDHDLLPYRKLRRNLSLVMVGHVVYSRIFGGKPPASLSKQWISGVLRKKIGYKGLIVTDDMDMRGLMSATKIEDAAVAALLAGIDILLVCQKEENVWRAYESVYSEAEKSRTFAKMVAQKSARVRAFKERSPEVQARFAPKPSQKTIDDLRCRIWEFTEEIRMTSMAISEDGGR